MKTIAQQLNIKDFPFNIKDKNGNLLYFEDSDGLWLKNEFDSKGNVTYSKHSNGYSVKRKFDSNGNEIYFENSEGMIIQGMITDNRPNFTWESKVVEIDGKKYQLKEVK